MTDTTKDEIEGRIAAHLAEARRLAALPPQMRVSAEDFATYAGDGAWRTAKTAASQHRQQAEALRALVGD